MPDCLRTTPLDIGFVNVSNTTLSSLESAESLQVLTTHSCNLLDCPLVLDDIFSTNPTEKFKKLERNQDKTHSISLHWCLDKHYLEQLIKKESIAWPRIADKNKWEKLDGAVSSLPVNSASLFDCAALLEDVIYDQACRLFGVFSEK